MKTIGVLFSAILITCLIIFVVFVAGSNQKEFEAPRGEHFEVHLDRGERFICSWESTEPTIFFAMKEDGTEFHHGELNNADSFTFTADGEGTYGYGWLANPEEPATVTYDAQIMPPNYVWAVVAIMIIVLLFLFSRFGGETGERA